MAETVWRWFGLDPAGGSVRSGEDLGTGVERRLIERGLQPVLVVEAERFERDLAGGPDGVPERLRTAAELADLRAIGQEPLQVTSSERTWDLDRERNGLAGQRRPGGPGRKHRSTHERHNQAPASADARISVRARAWTRDLVAVSIVIAASGEALPGTQRLFPADECGLIAAAAWRGQLEYACDNWTAEPNSSTPADRAADGSADTDAVGIAHLLDRGT